MFNDIFIFVFIFILVVSVLRNLLFWGKVLQQNEYRFDRMKDFFIRGDFSNSYLSTFGVMYVIFFVLYFARYIFADTIPYDPNSIVAFSDRAMYDLGLLGIFFILLFLEVLVFIYKLIRKKAILPKFTSRYLLILLVSFSLFWLYLYLFFSLYFFEGFVYVAYVLFPLFVIIGSIVVYPIAYYMRVRYIANAKAKISRYKNMKKVCITGSYGKSSVKEFLFSMLAVKSSVFKTPENKNSEMGVSEAILTKLDKEYEYGVFEMGAYSKGEIRLIGDIVDHNYAIITAIGSQHLGLFGSRENIIKAKSEIIEKVRKNSGTLYINYDSEGCRKVDLTGVKKVVRYSLLSDDVEVVGKILSEDENRTSFELKYGDFEGEFETGVVGNHFVLNLLGVIAYLVDNGYSIEEIKLGLKNIGLPKGTMQVVKKENGLILIDDTYNLSEEGLKKGVESLKVYEGKKKILVMDDIMELGREAKAVHKRVGEYIQNSQVDSVVYIGKNYKNEFEEGYGETMSFADVVVLKKDIVVLFEGMHAKVYFDKMDK